MATRQYTMETAILNRSVNPSEFMGNLKAPRFVGPADSLTTPRKITITGPLTGEVTFDGSTDVTVALSTNTSTALKSGIVIPWYLYPSNASLGTDAVLNAFIATRNMHPTVPVHVIVNPDSGPGTAVDTDYQGLITALNGAGCTVLGYVPTTYGARSKALIKADVAKYQQLYTGIDGIFFDEASNTDTPANIAYYTEITTYAHGRSLTPVYLNAGTDIPDSFYSAAGMFDYIVVYENNIYPETIDLDMPAGATRDNRSSMVYNQALNAINIQEMLAKTKMVYVSDCGAGYDTLPTYIDALFGLCASDSTELIATSLTLTTAAGSYTVGVDDSGGLVVNGTPVVPVNVARLETPITITTNTTITVTDLNKEYFFLVDSGVTVTLPPAIGNMSRYNIKCIGASCTIVPSAPSESIDGDTQVTLTSMNSIGFRALNGNWWCF